MILEFIEALFEVRLQMSASGRRCVQACFLKWEFGNSFNRSLSFAQ
ncbi:hypothetical protein EV07_1574 [Prochlorococcus sp. MIT 0603]|nr:hypothetical protein EV07_1574 [Prochlorococcus sp. MIT 0603]